jgi:hypothetical protein
MAAENLNRSAIDDASCPSGWARIAGTRPTDWTQPDGPLTVEPHQWARMKMAAVGLSGVARLSQIINEDAESPPSQWMVGGLEAAIVSLADVIRTGIEAAEDTDSARRLAGGDDTKRRPS